MSKTSQRDRAAEVRREDKRQRITRLAARVDAELAIPNVPAVVDPKDGMLNKDALLNDLDVQIVEWEDLPDPAFPAPDILTLEMATVADDGSVGEFKPVGASHDYNSGDSATFPITVTVPKSELTPDGPRRLRYHIRKYTGLDVYSPDIALFIDRIPPWGNTEPTAVTLPSSPITDAYFTANPTGITVTLPAYEGQDPRDFYAVYYANTVPELPNLPPPVASGTLATNRQVLIPKDTIEQAGDGHFYVVYLLIDKATNRSRISEIASVDVNLGLLPLNLKAPVVPLAADSLIDLADAQAGVTVEIPRYDNSRTSDVVEVTWGTAPPFTEQLGSQPFPRAIVVPAQQLLAAYGKADTVVPTTVSYRILRGRVPYPAPNIDVDVDFSVIGPPRPDPDPTWPDPINAQLLAPVVMGKVSQTAGKLERKDAGKPADLTFTLYTPAVDGEVVDFYWDGTLVTEAQYVVDTNDGPDITVEVPWSYILTSGNKADLPVYYTIRKARDQGNEQHSVTALVLADAITEVPAPAEFQRKPGLFLNCNSLWEDPQNPSGEPAFKVFVPPVAKYLPTGGEVTITWTALVGLTGTTPIPEVELSQTLTLSADEARDGVYWEIKPYVDHILPIYKYNGTNPDGRGQVTYSLDFGGEELTSETVEAYVGLATGAGTCPIP
jgi:hypothetical protein